MSKPPKSLSHWAKTSEFHKKKLWIAILLSPCLSNVIWHLILLKLVESLSYSHLRAWIKDNTSQSLIFRLNFSEDFQMTSHSWLKETQSHHCRREKLTFKSRNSKWILTNLRKTLEADILKWWRTLIRAIKKAIYEKIGLYFYLLKCLTFCSHPKIQEGFLTYSSKPAMDRVFYW